MIGLLLLASCLAPPAPSWAPSGRLHFCEGSGLPRREARAEAELKEATRAKVSVRAWSDDELVALGLSPSALHGLVFLEAKVEVAGAPIGPVYPKLLLLSEAAEIEGCRACDYRWVAEQLGEWEDRPVEPSEAPPPSTSSAAGDILRGPKPKGLLGALANIITLPVRLVIGGVVMAADALGSIGGGSSGPTTERVYGGPRTDQVYATLYPEPSPASPGQPGAAARLFQLNFLEDRPDPVLYPRDELVVILEHKGPGICSPEELHRFPLPPGEDMIERINHAAP